MYLLRDRGQHLSIKPRHIFTHSLDATFVGASDMYPGPAHLSWGGQGTGTKDVGDGAPSPMRDSNQSPLSCKDITIGKLNKKGKQGWDSNPFKSSTPNKVETKEPSKVTEMTPTTMGGSTDPTMSDSGKFNATGEDSLDPVHSCFFDGTSSGESPKGYKTYLFMSLILNRHLLTRPCKHYWPIKKRSPLMILSLCMRKRSSQSRLIIFLIKEIMNSRCKPAANKKEEYIKTFLIKKLKSAKRATKI